MIALIAFPFIANSAGWIMTEITPAVDGYGANDNRTIRFA